MHRAPCPISDRRGKRLNEYIDEIIGRIVDDISANDVTCAPNCTDYRSEYGSCEEIIDLSNGSDNGTCKHGARPELATKWTAINQEEAVEGAAHAAEVSRRKQDDGAI